MDKGQWLGAMEGLDMKIGKTKQSHRLFVRKFVSKGQDQFGREYVKSQWEEVPEINLGSYKNPNKEILEFLFIPIEENESNMDMDELFKRFFRQ